jgi:acyl carrier protein
MARLDEDFDIRLSENELAGLNKIEDIIEILKQNNKISDFL